MGQRLGGLLSMAGWGWVFQQIPRSGPYQPNLPFTVAERQPALGRVVLDVCSQRTEALHMEVRGTGSGCSNATWQLLRPL